MTVHYDTGPSALPRLLACPGSRRLCAGLPDNSGRAADDGSDTHELVAKAYAADVDAADLVGQALPNGGQVDTERAERAQVALDAYRATPGTHHIESWVDLSQLAGEPSGGTCDFYAYDSVTRTLTVLDYKDGREPVPVDSPQLLAYAAGAALQLTGTPIDTVTVGIIQPKVEGAPQTRTLPFSELNDWVQHVYVPGIEASRDPAAPLVAGEKQCRWCKAKGQCPALAEQAMTSMDVVASDFDDLTTPPDPQTLGSDFLARVVLKSTLIRQWLDAVDAEVKTRMEGGEQVAGLKLIRGRRGNRQWVEDQQDSVASILRTNYGLATESIYKLTMLSPAQICKLPEVKGKEDLLAAFVIQSEGAITVAPLSAKGEAITALSDFQSV